ncbi:MAG: protein translocase subunit SecD [Eubacterium sp.]|nr:protein translocase subunit SecD [Eubacterium sp.]
MKKAKRNAVLTLIIFVLLVAGAVYTILFGLGAENAGRAEDIILGLDLRGGVSVTYEIVESDATDAAIAATQDKLQRRVDNYSTDGEVYKEGSNRLTVEIPVDTSKYDPNKILDEMGRPGTLEFMDTTNYELFAAGKEYTAALTGSDVQEATGGIREDQTTGKKENVVSLQFTEEGAKKFADVTSANVGKPVYIVYDGVVASAPTVNEAITGGSAEINNISTYEEAESLASTIKIGALPLTLRELRSQVVGAKLGSDAVRTSLLAGAIGLGIVFLIMIIVFRFPGFIASIALSVYVILELFFLQSLGISLTLPGIAGIILSIGMAVDANVIIFTRIKEEIADGKTVKTAIKNGFSKAFSAIFDGNITTIIAGVVLLWMGSGSVKGFAKTLILGIVLSMFTALVVTRLLLNAFANLGVTNKKLYGEAKHRKVVKFSRAFRITATISILTILTGIAFLFINKGINGRGDTLNYSLEFSGGTSTTVTFDKEYTLAEAESEIAPLIAEAAEVQVGTIQIQIVDNTNQIIFKTSELDEAKRTAVANKLEEKFGLSDDKIDSQNISSTISSEMQRDAIIAVIVASILMLIYIALRFSDVRFGAAAVIALIHDVMVVFMVYSVAYLSVGGTFIACMLTIVGYSINATIIIFDRIRENLKIMKTDYDTIVDTSISQTLTRNIYSTLTTFSTILMLYILGVASLKEFTLTLIAGLLCGLYSSVFITGPLWLFMKKHIGKKKAVEKDTKQTAKA